MAVSAVDSDIGDNGRVTYAIDETTNPNDTFKIDATSGTIRVAMRDGTHVDRELIDQYRLAVVASDHGVPPRSTTTFVVIDVLDVNGKCMFTHIDPCADNPPRFAHDRYDLYIAENLPIGSVVDRLVAIDPDVGPNAHIRYTINVGDDADSFELMEPANVQGYAGRELRTRIELDYEQRTEYRLQVRASSGDLSSQVDVVVHVTDENDNRPVLGDFMLVVANDAHHPPPDKLPLMPA
jgi:hypothetical protein